MSAAYPTNYFRHERRDVACPALVLQQWWTWNREQALQLIPPWAVGASGEWRDVPIVQEEKVNG